MSIDLEAVRLFQHAYTLASSCPDNITSTHHQLALRDDYEVLVV